MPLAITMLADDDNRYVRKEAAGLFGPAVHRRADVLDALVRAHAHDPAPLVRKVAGWWIPGGPRFRRTAPRRLRSAGRS